MASISAVTLTDRELDPHLETATRKIQSFRYELARAETPADGGTLRGKRVAYRPLRSFDRSAPRAEEEISLGQRVREIKPGDELYTDVEHHVIRVLRRGTQIYFEIYDAYERASGLDRLKQANQRGELAARDENELGEKLETAAAAALFALGCFVYASLRDFQAHETEKLSFEVDALEKLPLASQNGALHAALFAFYEAIDAHARDDASLVKSVRDCAEQVALQIRTLHGSLQHAEFYTRYHFRIEPDEVRIAGFELPEVRKSSEILVPAKRPEEVVGNHIAKLEASRIAQRLACYDAERQANPFVDLGAFTFTFIGDGSPGTGKTTLIQMIVTLLREYCEVARLPLRYRNFSVDEISDYQGRSGQNARAFCREIIDPRVVGFGTIDDVDQVCGNRNDKNASAGQLEVSAVFMQAFAGADTIVRGNATFGLFSNYPEKVDDALRQRMQSRFLVDGPRTRDDFTDLFHLFLNDNWELPLGSDYEPLLTQQVRRVIQEKYAEHDRPVEPELLRIFERTIGPVERTQTLEWRDFGNYLHALHEHDPRFTGRAVRNISDAIRSRVMDFDLPGEWFRDPSLFFSKDYETRTQLLAELRGKITVELAIQEINRYAQSELRYSNAAEQRELEERTRQILLDARARRAAAEQAGK